MMSFAIYEQYRLLAICIGSVQAMYRNETYDNNAQNECHERLYTLFLLSF